MLVAVAGVLECADYRIFHSAVTLVLKHFCQALAGHDSEVKIGRDCGPKL